MIIPEGEVLKESTKLYGGFSSEVIKVVTDKNTYVLRHPKKPDNKKKFEGIVAISNEVHSLDIGPKVIQVDDQTQEMLIEYLEPLEEGWPQYKNDSSPYEMSIKMLKEFHDKMSKPSHPKDKNSYYPFNHIFPVYDKLKSDSLPKQYKESIEYISKISQYLNSWLKKNAVLCHGDCHKGNVILSKYKNKYKTKFIDFDDSCLGHPLYDLAKLILTFGIYPLPKSVVGFGNYPEKLLLTYFNRKPTKEELLHLDLMYLNMLIIIATSNFEKVKASTMPKLTLKEMENLFTKKLPPFYTYYMKPNIHKDPKLLQEQACSAIHEFLEKYKKLNLKI